MAQRARMDFPTIETRDEWLQFFSKDVKLTDLDAQSCADKFVNKKLSGQDVLDLIFTTQVSDNNIFGISMGHLAKTQRYLRQLQPNINMDMNTSILLDDGNGVNRSGPKIPRPTIHMDISQIDFDQFTFEWRIYKQHYKILNEDLSSNLLHCCDVEVRKRIRIEQPNFTTNNYDEDELLKIISGVVLSKTSQIIHIKEFYDIIQQPDETCVVFLGRLQSKASCCDFKCEHCNEVNVTTRIKERFIIGLKDKVIQTAILKSESVNPGTPLNKLLSEALTLEQSIKEQAEIRNEIDGICYINSNKNYGRMKYTHKKEKGSKKNYLSNQMPQKKICFKCGTTNHSLTNKELCKAINSTCHKCGKVGHFSNVCMSRQNTYNNIPEQHTAQQLEISDMQCMSIQAKTPTLEIQIKPQLSRFNKNSYLPLCVFPDTGANICLFGIQQLGQLKLCQSDLTDCNDCISVAGGTSIKAIGKCMLSLLLNNRNSLQLAYFAPTADRFFLSRQACIDLNIVPASYPYPPDMAKEIMKISQQMAKPRVLPRRPKVIPYEPVEANIEKLKKFLLLEFGNSAFNNEKPFPKLSTPPAHIHLKPNYVKPTPAFWPAKLYEHWSEEVRQGIENDVAAGILTKVPFNEPTEWCARMVVVEKKNGKLRRTVDYQQLNSQCLREPNYSESPFHTCRRVPQGTWKSTFDAVDGYHSVEIDDESSKLTTFITPWGRYRYLRFPQGHCAAGDAFNGRIEQILSEIPRLVRIIDDVCIYDLTIEQAFWHAWQLLTVCAKHGIVINKDKFKFCSKTVDFAGLSLTEHGIVPSEKMLRAIKNFPPPSTLTKARAFFGLVTQLQWAYSNSAEMAPFRSLVKPNACYNWTEELKQLFQSCKDRIISQVKEGVKKYDVNRYTCLQTDYCKDGLGYLLLQKYCACTLDKAPLCCREGWKLVFAGSRFTKGAEARYSPTEGEALAVTWALNHAEIFTKGCKNLLVSTDHKPLLGIFNSKPFEDIKNPRLARLKEHTLQFTFSVKHNAGKWHRAPDALSRSPSIGHCFILVNEPCTSIDVDVDHVSLLAIAELSDAQDATSLEEVKQFTDNDNCLQLLKVIIQEGFPESRNRLNESIRRFYDVKEHLWVNNEIIMFKSRIVIPKLLRPRVLQNLHSAHQGVEGMRARAANSIYWPGINHDIKQTRRNCKACDTISPSQAREPLQLIPPSEYPFQQICADAFEIRGVHYVVVVDRYSGWNFVYYIRSSVTSKHLIKIFRSIFTNYGVAERLYTDGGLPFQSKDLSSFLRIWNVTHTTSSAAYPQANGRAELAVKSSKRTLMDNVGPYGIIDTDKVSKALLQYRNTPLKGIGLSPAQLLFNRDLRDSIPVDPGRLRPSERWLNAAMNREQHFSERNSRLEKRYNTFSRPLSELSLGSDVIIQDPTTGKWNRRGRIVEAEGRKYTIRVYDSNRVISRNRRFLKPYQENDDSSMLPLIQESNPTRNDIRDTIVPTEEGTSVVADNKQPETFVPLMMRRLEDYNKPGRNELNSSR